MTTRQIVHLAQLADVPAQPWRNGGGVTHELLAWPQVQGWGLRVSVATIAADGPFSAFPGVDRWFTVLAGEGVVLDLPGGACMLACGDAPLYFAGEAAPLCRLRGGPTRDLNFMAQRAAGQSSMRAARVGDRMIQASVWRGLYCSAPAQLRVHGNRVNVPAACLAWGHRPSPWQLDELHGAAWWLTLAD